MSAPAISQNFSGVIIDQNASPRTSITISDESLYFQEFTLPEELERGQLSNEVTFPSLSGFQILLGIAENEQAEAKFNWTFEQYLLGSGWSPIFKGSVSGLPLSGERIWVNVLFDETFEVQPSMVPSELRDEAPTGFRISLSFTDKITKLWYVTPNPFGHGEALHEVGGKEVSLKGSLNFRVLALVADSGTDFLGNPYRSVATISSAESAGATPASQYWLSSPQPTQFAVVSHYSDLRPFPTTPKYGKINFIVNPNFEYDIVASTPAYWEGKGATVLVINRWRGEWNELESYTKGEGVRRIKLIKIGPEEFEEEIKTYKSKVNENRAHDPLEDETELFWEPATGQFEPVKGTQYLEVKALAAKRGVRLEEPVGGRKGTVAAETRIVTLTTGTTTALPVGHQVTIEGLPGRLTVMKILAEKEFEVDRTFNKAEEEATAGKVSITVLGGEVPVKIAQPSTFSFWMRGEASSVKTEEVERALWKKEEEEAKITKKEREEKESPQEIEVVFGNKTVGEEIKKVFLTQDWTRYEVTLTPKETGETTAYIEVKKSQTFFLDVVMVDRGTEAGEYIDGDVINCVWNGPKGRSSSSQLEEKESKENVVVVDAVMIDPITPGVGFNIYYTNDLKGSEEGEPTIEDWESKVWTHVPQTYVTSGKTTYVLPKPVVAKFFKIEFTNLQARPYDPGDYQTPVLYKTFPQWVSEVFLSLASSPNFVVNKVGVTYDKLELMYNYHLADLEQKPTFPIPNAVKSGEAQDVVDPTTLANIKQVINTYTEPTAARANTRTALGLNQKSNALREVNAPVEAEPSFQSKGGFPVSSLDRSNIVIDQNTPVMFFYVNCRHEYKEQYGRFAEKKAYFAGLKQLAFIRQSYSTTFDGELYIESGGDDVNTDRQDFVVEDGVWYTN